MDFSESKVYESEREPGYTSWVSFFPGNSGEWYISCEEICVPETPMPKLSREEWFARGVPVGYDTSEHAIEVVLLKSDNGLKSWM